MLVWRPGGPTIFARDFKYLTNKIVVWEMAWLAANRPATLVGRDVRNPVAFVGRTKVVGSPAILALQAQRWLEGSPAGARLQAAKSAPPLNWSREFVVGALGSS